MRSFSSLWGKALKGALCLTVILVILVAYAPVTSAANIKLAAFTFDDGPHATYTPLLLDGLKERGVKATFFILGSNVPNKRGIITRMHEEGHQIANHSWSHTSFTSISDAQIRNEISRTSALLTEITGQTDFVVRPPNGAVSSRVAAAIGAPVIMWNVDPTGGRHPTAQSTMTSNLISSTRDGSIIIMHDTSAANVNSSLAAIDALKARGFEFVTLNELFRLKGVTPRNGELYYSASATAFRNYDESQLSRHWAATAINFVVDKGIMGGDGTGFRPNIQMTRGVAVTVLWRMVTIGGMTPAGGAGPPGGSSAGNGSGHISGFTDVPAGQWFSQSVEWACANGIAGGYSETEFGVNDNISREQFYAMLDRCRILFGVNTPAGPSAVSYGDDWRISGWARQSVMNIRNAGFSSRNDVEIFRPGDDITRAEAAELIMWLMTV